MRHLRPPAAFRSRAGRLPAFAARRSPPALARRTRARRRRSQAHENFCESRGSAAVREAAARAGLAEGFRGGAIALDMAAARPGAAIRRRAARGPAGAFLPLARHLAESPDFRLVRVDNWGLLFVRGAGAPYAPPSVDAEKFSTAAERGIYLSQIGAVAGCGGAGRGGAGFPDGGAGGRAGRALRRDARARRSRFRGSVIPRRSRRWSALWRRRRTMPPRSRWRRACFPPRATRRARGRWRRS